ncbi:MAG: twitching motility protein PilT [Candidatus Entotheonella gemina]|uniref:Twitching motility protein PilT n=1 Tax=Candidatus Entotheonella gemina TaxID=1429439 RepID=W4LYK9_9BACT|nr:MAG: twitching motility protein PilT [Candidatus Entotheonella gemina]
MILLDTHVLVWLTQGLDMLGPQARQLADDALGEDELAVSAITFWEVEMLIQRGRIDLMQSTTAWRQTLLDQGLLEMPIAGDMGIRAAALPDFHRDPADRFITATALHYSAQLVTADERILDWPGALLRYDARQ